MRTPEPRVADLMPQALSDPSEPGRSITFLGAAGTVTGSRYLVESGGMRVLVDCGLFQGLKSLRLRNREPFPVDPASLDAVILTHAHLDHTGYLPALCRDGYRGQVYCTPPTADLCAILLPDSGHLQEEEADHAARHGYSKHSPPLPLYTRLDAERSLGSLRRLPFGDRLTIGRGVSFRFSRAGHMLGAASVQLTTPDGEILFSGDLGRPYDSLLPSPEPPPPCDVLVVESTYGDRLHDTSDPADRLAEIIQRTAARGGSVIIPSFAVGRAQSLVYHVHALKTAGRIPDLPVFVDSPMAAEATHAYRAHATELRLSGARLAEVFSAARAVATPTESKRIDRMHEPRVIIAASGMATGGRVLFHLAAMGGDPRNTILFAGYQAAGTRGASLLAGERELKIHGQRIPIRAEVASLDSLSAHADRAEILGWLARMPGRPGECFITHGEPVAADALRRGIEERLGWRCTVPDHRQVARL
jgi:metallo-beta-lactamase family protein